MSSIKSKINSLVNYLENSSGHTRLLMDGFIDYNGTRVLLTDDKSFLPKFGINMEDKRVRIVPYNNFEPWIASERNPMLIDNSALLKLLKEVQDELNKI